jgi:hypothetical protein
MKWIAILILSLPLAAWGANQAAENRGRTRAGCESVLYWCVAASVCLLLLRVHVGSRRSVQYAKDTKAGHQ